MAALRALKQSHHRPEEVRHRQERLQHAKEQSRTVDAQAEALRMATSAHREHARMARHKFRWLEEWRALCEERALCEHEVDGFLRAVSDPLNPWADARWATLHHEANVALDSLAVLLSEIVQGKTALQRRMVQQRGNENRRQILSDVQDLRRHHMNQIQELNREQEEMEEATCMMKAMITAPTPRLTTAQRRSGREDSVFQSLLGRLEAQFREEENALRVEWQQSMHEMAQALPLDDTTQDQASRPGVRTGWWPVEENDRFVHAVRESRHAHWTQQEFTERLAMELPDRSPWEISFHSQWYWRMHFYKTRKRALHIMWQDARDKLGDYARHVVEEAQNCHSEAERQAREQSDFEDYQHQLHRKLAEWREEQAAKQKAREEEEALVYRANLAKEHERKKQEDAKRALTKQKIAVYHEDRKIEEEEVRNQEHEAWLKLEEDRQRREEYNQERTRYRSQRTEKELLRRRESVQQRRKEEEKREERLEALRRQVRVEAPQDPSRLLAATESRKVEVEKEEAWAPPRHGFTVDELMRDQRFRLGSYLHDAGLNHLSYAREAIARARPARPPRPDLYTSDQLAQRSLLYE